VSDAVELHSIDDRVEIAPGVHMARLGLGTYKATEGPDVEGEVAYGLELGYRHVDTAALYGNETGVGRALRASGVPRDEYTVATKVWNSDQGYRSTLEAFDRSLEKLGLDYVDLYLVHWPLPGLTADTWRAMEEVHASGRARAIGVCNFLVHHLQDLLSFAQVPPALDQVEHHVRLRQQELGDYCAGHGITLQAWAPIMRGQVTAIPAVTEIGARHGKTAPQVAVRWILQHGVTTVPKSVHRDRIAENADVFDFVLSDAEMATLDALDRGERIGGHPDQFSGIVGGLTRLIHPPR
jgi:diketogulonate reductase-like aldo/keto reductase